MKLVIFVAVISVASASLQSCNFDETSAETTRTGHRSGKGDDNLSIATCGKGYLMVGCDCKGWIGRDDDCDGARFHHNSTGTYCHAYNGADGEGIVAYARCMKIAITCSTPAGDMPATYCPQYYKLSGCTMHSSIRHNLWHATNQHPVGKRGSGGFCPIQKADVIFVLDGSGSMRTSGFNAAIEFVKGAINVLPVATDGVHVGHITFNSYVVTAHQIELSYTPKATLISTISGYSLPGGGTGTSRALDEALAMFSRGGRTGAMKVVIVITDGYSNSYSATRASATALHNAGVTVLAIGAGPGVNVAEVTSMASDPTHVLLTAQTTDLEHAQFIIDRVGQLVSCMGLCYTTTGCTDCSVQARCVRVDNLLPNPLPRG